MRAYPNHAGGIVGLASAGLRPIELLNPISIRRIQCAQLAGQAIAFQLHASIAGTKAGGSKYKHKALSRLRATVSDSELEGGELKNRDGEILALLVPALGSVFLDPAMQVIDTGSTIL